MKINFKYILLLLLNCFTQNIYTQVSFTIDSLEVNDVIWFCQNDVVIEDFAYGPHFDVWFSIKNCSQDTISIPTEKITLYLQYGSNKKKWRKEIFITKYLFDTLLTIYPNTTFKARGYIDLVLTGEIKSGMNYRLVNFLPQIENIIKRSIMILDIPGFEEIETKFSNCYVGKHFFIDGTNKESIYRIDD